MFGRDNLKEVVLVIGSGFYYCFLEELEEVLCIYYEIVKVYEECICLIFGILFEVFYYLKYIGVVVVR